MAARRCRRFGSPASELAGPTLVTGRSSSGDAASVIDDDFFQSTRVHVEMKPRTATSFAIHGCARTFRICARVFSSGSLKANKRIGAGVASPVSRATFSFSCLSVKVVNPQPV